MVLFSILSAPMLCLFRFLINLDCLDRADLDRRSVASRNKERHSPVINIPLNAEKALYFVAKDFMPIRLCTLDL